MKPPEGDPAAPARDPESPRGGSGRMFDAIASKYDLVNRVLSLGMDQSWRRRAVRSLELGDSPTVLDLATGTADLAILIAQMSPGSRVIGVDPSTGMLGVGRTKVESAGLGDRIDLREGDAQALDLPDRSVDAITMAFGIRNVPDRPRALREMARVTRDGGRIAILELSEPKDGAMGALARFYVRGIVPRVGGTLSGKREYRYLQESIAAFPPPDEFADLMRSSGLEVVSVTPLMFGASVLFVATPDRGASRNTPSASKGD
ncbi:MAG: bifunctional demethylmenaquinone methyltransferase/2-methoxy-6-polyprenyl-1,4-benzoquinol methylase UbiE [Polyangiaceae bacterium]